MSVCQYSVKTVHSFTDDVTVDHTMVCLNHIISTDPMISLEFMERALGAYNTVRTLCLYREPCE